MPRVGYLAIGRGPPPPVFVQKMREQGYIDGQTAAFEYRFAEGWHERLQPLAQELLESRVDVIFAFGDEAIVAAQVATKTIPIVMLACDAVTTGFVASLARPGGNTTGVTCITTELSGKRVAVFREMLPGLKHLAVLYNPENKSKRGDFQKTREVANSLGVRVAGFEVRELEDIERVFAGWKTATSRVRTWRLNTGGLGQVDRLPALAAELAGHSVAIFVTTGGGSAALAAKAATSTIPIVFSMGDP